MRSSSCAYLLIAILMIDDTYLCCERCRRNYNQRANPRERKNSTRIQENERTARNKQIGSTHRFWCFFSLHSNATYFNNSIIIIIMGLTYSKWLHPLTAQKTDDGTYDPSPFTLAFGTSTKSSYVAQTHETKYTGTKPILVVCTDDGK